MSDRLKKHHRERLLRLADKLEGKGPYEAVGPVPVKRFNLDVFQNCGFSRGDCGTVACACGWAATDPWFENQGFPQSWYPNDIGNFFGLDYLNTDDVEILFMSENYRSHNPRPTTVAKRIRQYVEQQS